MWDDFEYRKSDFSIPQLVFMNQKKAGKRRLSLRKGAYWAMGGILASLVGRGVGCIAATYVGLLEPEGSKILSKCAEGPVSVGLVKLR